MWIVLSLLVAVLTAVQDILNKKATTKCHYMIVTWAWWFFSLPLLYIMTIFEPISSLNTSFWKLAFISSILLTATLFLYIKGLQLSDLSLSIPMLTFTPAFLLITSPLMLNEHPNKAGIFGVLAIVIGAYILLMSKNNRKFFDSFRALKKEGGVICMLVVAFMFSICGNIDKMGVQNSSPLAWILVLNTLIATTTFIVMIVKVKDIYTQISRCWVLLLIIGTCNGLSLIFQMNALQMAFVPYIIAIKRISVVLVALYGLIILKEKGLKKRLIGVGLMVSGVFLISLLG